MNIKRLDSPSLVVALAVAGAFLLGSQLPSYGQGDVTFLQKNRVWEYYQPVDGEPATSAPPDDGFLTWKDPGYDDSAWRSGPAQLGFTEGDEATLLERGATTYYFRTTIQVTQSQLNQVNQLVVDLLRDDGAVVYLNGFELLRDNMPDGEIDYDSVALAAVSGGDENTFFQFGYLLEFNPILELGENTIAVEIHQNTPGSSDISFQMGMEGYEVIPLLGLWEPPVGITFELADFGSTEYSVRDYLPPAPSDPPEPFELGWYGTATGFQSFVAPVLSKVGPNDGIGFSEGQCMVTSEGNVKIWTNLNAPDIPGFGPEDLFDFDPDQNLFPQQVYRVNLSNHTDAAVQFGLRAYNNNGSSSMPNNSYVRVYMYTSSDGETFEETLLDEWESAAANNDEVDIVKDSASKKVIVPTAAIPGWETPEFNDAGWTTGVSGAGYERSAGYDPYIGGPALDMEARLYGVNPTLYMRIPFNVANKDVYTAGLKLCVRYDDGFVAYLNGVEVARANAPGGAPQWNSEASATHADGDAIVWQEFPFPLTNLRNGANVLAVQGLNSPSTSSDMLLGVELKGLIIGGGGGGKRSLSEFVGPLDGPFRTYKYNVPNNAQTVAMKWEMGTPTAPNIQQVSAIFLDNILFTGTPISANSFTSWVQLNSDYELDDQGAVDADPEGDQIRNGPEYAFGGSLTEPDTGILPTMEVKTVELLEGDSVDRFVMTWRQFNESAGGTLDGGSSVGFGEIAGGFQVRDVKYVPQFSTDGLNWEDGEFGPRVARLCDSDGNELLEEILPESEEDFIDVSAYWSVPEEEGLDLKDLRRVFGRIKIVITPSQYY